MAQVTLQLLRRPRDTATHAREHRTAPPVHRLRNHSRPTSTHLHTLTRSPHSPALLSLVLLSPALSPSPLSAVLALPSLPPAPSTPSRFELSGIPFCVGTPKRHNTRIPPDTLPQHEHVLHCRSPAPLSLLYSRQIFRSPQIFHASTNHSATPRARSLAGAAPCLRAFLPQEGCWALQ